MIVPLIKTFHYRRGINSLSISLRDPFGKVFRDGPQPSKTKE